ncbi:MAG: hypothetical protein IKK29_00875 [Christensenellaceae bacterium]|nr:hypothetical protein [Christensenellaceae bacterium]
MMIKKINYIRLVCIKNFSGYKATEAKMKEAKEKFGVTFEEYFKNDLYNMTPTQQAVEARRIIIRRDNRNKRLDKISAATGLTHDEIRAEIKAINKKSSVKMSIVRYAKYEVYRFEGEALDEFLGLFVRRDRVKEELLADFVKIDKGILSYEDILEKLNLFYEIIEKMMSESLISELGELILPSYPEIAADSEKRRKVAVDMEATRVLLPFSLEEYVCFHFAGKSIAEKRTFISDKERLEILNKLNNPKKFDLLDNKAESYRRLAKYYGRELLLISSQKDFGAFEKFCADKNRIVVKPPCDTMGRGVRAIDLPEKSALKELFDSLLAEFDNVLVEELITAHESIRRLNPDSVNTVRVITYFDGRRSLLHDSFIKVGQKGSFVDNGGAGGILVHVDPKTGMLDSEGCDENGVIYSVHPHTGVVFRGYQLPNWEKAIELAHELSSKISGLKYIGWDFTLNAEGEWIIVEGNAKTQFYGQQAPRDIGVREDFLRTIGYKK